MSIVSCLPPTGPAQIDGADPTEQDGLLDDWPQGESILTLTEATMYRVTARVTLTNDAGLEVSISYGVTLYTVAADLGFVGTPGDPDAESDIWINYLGADGDLVVPGNSVIDARAALLWAEAGGEFLEYARLCYRWTAENVAYASTGGTWTDLASVRPDGTYHVWADFYLAGYGWIPADPTYAATHYETHGVILDDYFGNVLVGTSGIIMHKGVHLLLDADGEHETHVDGLQTFAFWNWYSSGGPGALSSVYILEAVPL